MYLKDQYITFNPSALTNLTNVTMINKKRTKIDSTAFKMILQLPNLKEIAVAYTKENASFINALLWVDTLIFTDCDYPLVYDFLKTNHFPR